MLPGLLGLLPQQPGLDSPYPGRVTIRIRLSALMSRPLCIMIHQWQWRIFLVANMPDKNSWKALAVPFVDHLRLKTQKGNTEVTTWPKKQPHGSHGSHGCSQGTAQVFNTYTHTHPRSTKATKILTRTTPLLHRTQPSWHLVWPVQPSPPH